MLNKKQNILREALTVVLLLASVALAEYWFFQLWRLDWKVPMLYGGDGIYWVGQIQRSFGELTGSLGWPFYQAPAERRHPYLRYFLEHQCYHILPVDEDVLPH